MTNPTNTQEDELRRIVESHMYLYAHATTPEARTRLVRKILALISTQREQEFWKGVQHVDEAREQARQELLELLDELENITRGTVCLYHHAQGERGTGYDCGCTTEIDREALDSFIQSKRATLKGDSDGNI